MASYLRASIIATFARMERNDIQLPPVWLGVLRIALRLAAILAAAYLVLELMDWVTAQATATGNGKLMIGMFAILLVAYAVLIAIPFMPGIEIGISLLLLKGARIAPLVYLATALGLLLAFSAGRLLPHKWLHNVLADLHLKRACQLVDRLAPMTREDRLAHLTARAPNWLKPLAGPWRYLCLALLINSPGNMIIGGAGGIALTAGFSRLFSPGLTALTFAVAVLPVPLMVWLTGSTRLLP